MARHWVGDTGDPGAAEPSAPRTGTSPGEREPLTEPVRRSVADDVTDDEVQ